MEPFLALPRYLVDAPAYRRLTPTARAVLVAVLHGYNGKNNGAIRFAVREGEAWGIGKSHTAVALRKLVAAGFLRVIQAGCFTSKRLAAEYALTWRPTDGATSQPATRDFLERKTSPVERTDSPADRTVDRIKPERRAA
jgi:hypothetical protein